MVQKHKQIPPEKDTPAERMNGQTTSAPKKAKSSKAARANGVKKLLHCMYSLPVTIPLYVFLGWCVIVGLVKGEPIPDNACAYSTLRARSCGIRQAVDTYTTSATIAKYGSIDTWNVSLVTDMSYLFYDLENFNEDLSLWDTGAVTNMELSTYNLFFHTKKKVFFDHCSCSLFSNFFSSAPNVSSLFQIISVLYYTKAFNSDLSTWNVDAVTDMGSSTYRFFYPPSKSWWLR
jgi:surface protein